MSSYSWSQELTLAITPKCTSALSIVGDVFILWEIYGDYRAATSLIGSMSSSSRRSSLSHQSSNLSNHNNRRSHNNPNKLAKNWNALARTIMGMTSIDILSSMAWFVSSWAVPQGTFALSSGNQITCNIQGFFLQLAIGAPLYNCSLALYYLLVLKYRWTDQQLALRVEKWMHLSILTFATGSSILLLILDKYSPTGAVCWVNNKHNDTDYLSDAHSQAWIYGVSLFYGPLWICVIACVASMTIIYHEVRKTTRRMQRYSITMPANNNIDVGESSATASSIHSNPSGRVSGRGGGGGASIGSQHNLGRSQKNSIRVAHQAILYSLSFLISWMPSTIWSIARWFDFDNFYLDFAAGFCEPLQGLWNVGIFVSRRSSSKRKLRLFLHTLLPWCISFNEEDYMDPSERHSLALLRRSNRLQQQEQQQQQQQQEPPKQEDNHSSTSETKYQGLDDGLDEEEEEEEEESGCSDTNSQHDNANTGDSGDIGVRQTDTDWRFG